MITPAVTAAELIIHAETRHAAHIGAAARPSTDPRAIVYVCSACWTTELSEALRAHGRADVLLGAEEMRRQVILLLDGYRFSALRDQTPFVGTIGAVCVAAANALYEQVKGLKIHGPQGRQG